LQLKAHYAERLISVFEYRTARQILRAVATAVSPVFPLGARQSLDISPNRHHSSPSKTHGTQSALVESGASLLALMAAIPTDPVLSTHQLTLH